MFQIESHSEVDTRNLGNEFGEIILPGIPVLLHGDLGTGKTVFVRGVGENLNAASE